MSVCECVSVKMFSKHYYSGGGACDWTLHAHTSPLLSVLGVSFSSTL